MSFAIDLVMPAEPNFSMSPVAHGAPSDEQKSADTSNTPKLPPCDQCRRRKVKCQQSNPGSCDRCVQSSLTCTRDIQRKKRGPKKGSGSVIAKLRGEHEQIVTQETSLPAFNLSSLDTQITGLRRTLSQDSELSPISSPGGSQYGDIYPPTPDPALMPRSVPLGLGDGISTMGAGGFSQSALELPPAWQIPSDQSLLQFSSPESTNGYLSVNDLAQQIFHEPMSSNEQLLYPGLPPTSMPPTSNPMGPTNSIDAIINANGQSKQPSPTGTAASSPQPIRGPKVLYRSDSGTSLAEPRLQSLANEIGMSSRLMSQCVKQYFRHLYPIMPILHEPSLRGRLMQTEDLSIDEKVLIMSLCAITVTHASPPSDLTLQDKHNLGREFLKQCFIYRHLTEFIENATLTTIISSFFISVTHFELKLPRSHHFYLREAVGLARETFMDSEKTNSDPISLICSQRMMALLFITERGVAILRNKPISITKLKHIPTQYFDENDRIVLAGFTSLCTLFSLLDEHFVELWQASEDDIVSSPLENVAAIQHKLNGMSFDRTQMTDIQKADVLITYQWLRLIFWQASMRHGLISRSSNDPIFWYDYPVSVARDLCRDMRGMQYEAILVHGLGIFEKIFEVAYTLMDALTIAKIEWSTSDDLRYLFACLSASPNSHSTYVKFLENKMDNQSNAASPYPGNGSGSPFSAAG